MNTIPKITIELNDLDYYKDSDLIMGLARRCLTEEEKHDPSLNSGGQTSGAYIGRLLKKLKLKYRIV